MAKRIKIRALPKVAFVGLVMLIVVTLLVMMFVGWFGMFLIGVIGLLITTRLELHDGIAVPDFDYGSTSIDIIARQREQRENAGWQDQIDEKKRRERQAYVTYILNTIWMAMIALGLVMFSMHQV
jgi:hypothetical protein